MAHPMITAHSGCEGTAENSLESLACGLALGADCVEVDVRLGGDGVLWLTHDLPKPGAALVRLEQAFAALADSNAAINCDLKECAALYPVLSLAEARGMGGKGCFSPARCPSPPCGRARGSRAGRGCS